MNKYLPIFISKIVVFFFFFQKYELATDTAKNKMYAFPKYVGYNADHSVPYENQYVLMRVK